MAVSFLEVQLDGQNINEISADILLSKAEIDHELSQHSTCKLFYRQTLDRRIPYESFLGKDLDVAAHNQDGSQVALFHGFVVRIDYEYEIEGGFSLVISAASPSYALSTERRCAYFRETEYSDLIQELIKPVDFDSITAGQGDEDTKFKNFLQFDESNWDFLIRVLDRYEAFVVSKDKRLRITDEFNGDEHTVEWRAENGLLSFKVHGLTTPRNLGGAHFQSNLATSKTFKDVKEDIEYFDPLGDFRSAAKAGSERRALKSFLGERFLASSHAQYELDVKHESKRQASSAVFATGSSQLPDLHPGDTVKVAGPIETSGPYGLVKVRHLWEPSGYRNEFYCTPGKKYIQPEAPPIPQHIGPIIGRVVENNHPNRIAFVRVEFLWDGNNESDWMPVFSPNAGADRGFYFLPEVGDQVLVSFFNGDTTRPYVALSAWNGVDTPPNEDLHGGEYPKNDLKRIVTKSGNRLVMDDKQGQETMVMATPKHVRVSLFDGGATMVLHSDGDIHINAGGTVHMKCKQFLREVG